MRDGQSYQRAESADSGGRTQVDTILAQLVMLNLDMDFNGTDDESN